MISTSSATDAVNVLWLDTLQRICGCVAHELRGALNGVAVNLEVVRSRSAKADAPASAVATFAGAAANQLEPVIEMSEALLALTRTAKSSVDVGTTTRQIVSLLAPAAKADGKSLSVDGSLEALGVTSADSNAARLAIGAGLLAAADAPNVVCRASGVSLSISGEGLGAPAEEVVAAVKEAGIEIQAESSAIIISFPR